MNAHDNSIVFALESELDRKIEELEQQCFNPQLDEVATLTVRTRRIQLIAVRSFMKRDQSQL